MQSNAPSPTVFLTLDIAGMWAALWEWVHMSKGVPKLHSQRAFSSSAQWERLACCSVSELLDSRALKEGSRHVVEA